MPKGPITRPSTNKSELEALVASILDEARRRGATQAEAGVSVDAGLSLTVRLGEVETLEHQRDRGLGVTVYFDQRKASASTADLSPLAVRETVEKACSIARYTAQDPFAGLADAERMASDPPDLDLSHPWDLAPEEAIELARECEAAARDHDERISNSEGASLSTHGGMRVYGNSHGFVGGFESTRHSMSCSVLAETDGAMERDYWYSTARRPDALESPAAIGVRAAQRVLRRLGARKLETRKAPVVFPAELARGLIGHFIAAIRGGAQYRESSFLLGAAGEQIFPDGFMISERPHLPGALGSAAFDNEGVATRDRELVESGILQGYMLSSYSARKLGLETTGHAGGLWNLLVKADGGDFAALLGKMNTGLLVSELIGQGVNPVTGDYSRGAAGFWVENGEIAYPVHEITIAGNLKDIYKNIVHVADDPDLRGTIRSGSMLVEEMTIAGA